MSNIYIQEPPTSGKVLLQTTVGDIDVELWTREAPKACRNFIQLCMEGYYDGTIFHRVVKGFIVQGGDPTGSGMGGESVFGRPFKDEFHSRLRFVRRGLVAMANAGKDDNGSQFFFTMGSCPELQSKHTIFGKVTGNTLYNMLKLEDSLVDQNERPLYPHKVITTKVLNNPFADIEPREVKKTEKLEMEEKKNRTKGTKNFALLSFGDEAEEEEGEVDAVAKEFRGKSKSSHDLTNDPNLSSVPAIKLEQEREDENDELVQKRKRDDEQLVERIRKKLAKDEEAKKQTVVPVKDEREEAHLKTEQDREEVRKEIRQIQRELAGKKKQEETKDDGTQSETTDPDDPLLADFHKEVEKYSTVKRDKQKKGSDREQQTMLLLSKFQEKLNKAKDDTDPKPDVPVTPDAETEEDEGWMTHVLNFEDQGPVFAKDASVKTTDTFEIFDPRNPINQRRRDAHKNQSKKTK